MITRPGIKYFIIAAMLLALSTPVAAAGNGITGLWEVEGTPAGAPGPAFTNLAQLGNDGSVTNLDPWFGTGLGQWEKVAGNLYAVTFTHFFLDGEAVGEVKVSATAELSQDRENFSGSFLTEISIGGIIVDSFQGTVEADRQ